MLPLLLQAYLPLQHHFTLDKHNFYRELQPAVQLFAS